MVALQFLVLSAVVRVRLGQRFMLGVLIQAHPFFVNFNSKWTTRSTGKTFSLLSTNTVSRKSVLTDGASTPAGECFSDDQQYINVKRMCDTSSFLYNAFKTRARICRQTGFHMQADGAAFGSPSGDNCGLA